MNLHQIRQTPTIILQQLVAGPVGLYVLPGYELKTELSYPASWGQLNSDKMLLLYLLMSPTASATALIPLLHGARFAP